jgi:hypothetical protein
VSLQKDRKEALNSVFHLTGNRNISCIRIKDEDENAGIFSYWEADMKYFLVAITILVCVSCINQTVNTESTFLKGHSYEEVWEASIQAVNDIDFTIDGMDVEAGFIGAESGPHILGGDSPTRLSIMIREYGDSVSLDCRVLQKEQFIDLFGVGKKIVDDFMIALNQNLN